MKHLEPMIDDIDATPGGGTTFEAETSLLAARLSGLWRSTSDAFAPLGKSFNVQQQGETEAKVKGMMLKGANDETDSEDALLRVQRLKMSVRGLVVQSVEPDHREETEKMLSQFSEAGDEFVRSAREFDPDIRSEDVFQALRNVWIINSMQVAFALPICLNRSGLAYSLLYPYTDNYLDAATVTDSEKQEFNLALARRLAGFKVASASRLAAKVSDLVEMIESEYPRALYPDVYKSLLAIHRAQENSLLQYADAECCAESGILRISVEKGGASVLADAYVAKGQLTPQEAEFAFGYGVFLQFIDDLQDVTEDLRSGHQTLFTLAAKEGALDGLTNRLVRFLNEILTSSNLPSFCEAGALAELVRKGCLVLILESIALNSGCFSNSYVEAVEAYSPMRFNCIREVHAQMRAKQKRLRKVFGRRQLIYTAATCA